MIWHTYMQCEELCKKWATTGQPNHPSQLTFSAHLSNILNSASAFVSLTATSYNVSLPPDSMADHKEKNCTVVSQYSKNSAQCFLLTFILLNSNCLTNKVIFLLDSVSGSKAGLCCICKTWLNSDTSIAVVSLMDYSFLENDSPSNMRIHSVGSYVHDDIKVGWTFTAHPNTANVFAWFWDNY